MFDLLQTWAAIHDKHNSGAAQLLPPPEWEKWFSFRKTDKSNKVIRDDVKNAVCELDAALTKGRAWLRKDKWRLLYGRLNTMRTALEKLQVSRLFNCCLKFASRNCYFTTDKCCVLHRIVETIKRKGRPSTMQSQVLPGSQPLLLAWIAFLGRYVPLRIDARRAST